MSEQRVRKETLELDKTLAALQDIVEPLRKDLPDLEQMAWAQNVAERPERGSKKLGWAHTDTGDIRAKQAFRELDHTAAAFLASARMTRNLFVGGPSAPSMMGTDLGDDTGAGAEAEHKRLLENQRKRRAMGHYTPNRSEPQPKVPGARRR